MTEPTTAPAETSSHPVLMECRGTVAPITLNRPAAMNAVNAGLSRALGAAMAELAADPDLRVGVVTGAGSQLLTAGRQTLRYTLQLADGHILPNTRLSARWRLTVDNDVETGPRASVLYSDTGFDWQTRTGSLVRIHWYQGGDAFGKRALDIAEKGVRQAEAKSPANQATRSLRAPAITLPPPACSGPRMSALLVPSRKASQMPARVWSQLLNARIAGTNP